MAEETEEEPDGIVPANDNSTEGDADISPWEKFDKVVLSIARLIGRQMAREHFEALQAANDNKSPAQEAECRDEDGETP